MPVIKPNTGIVTQINVFDVPENGQGPLIALLQESAQYAQDTPGWLSASIHRSLDGRKVANYAQSADMQAAKAVIDRLRDAGYLERNKALGIAHPGLYEVVYTLDKKRFF
jgi:hypothetical protein